LAYYGAVLVKCSQPDRPSRRAELCFMVSLFLCVSDLSRPGLWKSHHGLCGVLHSP